MEAVTFAELVDQQVVPGQPFASKKSKPSSAKDASHCGRGSTQTSAGARTIFPPEGSEKSMLVPLRTVVGHSFYIHTPSYTCTHLYIHTHTHLPTNDL